MALGSAAARRLGNSSPARRRVAVVGRDPRASGEMLEAAVIAGLTSEGVDALRVGVLPTPAVAYLTNAYDAEFGVMISASHNPMPDNGIKIFGAGGHKLDDATEDRIEELVAAGPGDRPVGAAIGRVVDADDALDRYLRHAGKAAHHPAGRADRRRRLRARRRIGRRAARLPGRRRQRHRDQRRTQRAQHQRRLRVHAHGVAAAGGGVPRRRPRPGPRRRRRPLPGRRRRRAGRRRRRHHGDPRAGDAARPASWRPTPWSPR